MAQCSVKAQRFDPHRNLEFRVKWDGRDVAHASKISALGGDYNGQPGAAFVVRFRIAAG